MCTKSVLKVSNTRIRIGRVNFVRIKNIAILSYQIVHAVQYYFDAYRMDCSTLCNFKKDGDTILLEEPVCTYTDSA